MPLFVAEALTIELAARIAGLTIEAIAARLDERFRLLTGGSRAPPPRHRLLQTALDWSCGLLSPDTQALLRCLAIFALRRS